MARKLNYQEARAFAEAMEQAELPPLGPEEEVLLEQLEWAGRSKLRCGVPDAGVDRRENGGYEPINIVGPSVPIAHLLSPAPIVDR